jgi:UDP-glucose 4-epimerase
LVGYSNLVNCAINNNIKRFLHFSTMDIYGKAPLPFIEDTIPKPEDPYGISKYAIELDLKSANEQFGLNYNIIRPHNVVGINQNIWDRYRNVLGIWTRKCLNHEPITVYGDGMQIRAFSDVKFYLEPINKLLFDQNINQEIYNIGADQHITILDAAKLMQKVAAKFGYHSDIVHLEARHEVMEAYPSHDKAKRDLNFVDNTVLEETLCELFFWAMHQPNREVKYVDYEIEKGLLPVWKK